MSLTSDAPAVSGARPCQCSRGDVRQFRNEEPLGGLALDGFTTAIIALGGGHVGMTRQALHGRDVGAGIQQVADGGPAQVVRAEAFPSLQMKD